MDLIEKFVNQTNLLPGDAIIGKKKALPLLNHFMVYLGRVNNEHVFMANYNSGTQIISKEQLYEFSNELQPTEIRRFKGNSIQRKAAVERALNRIDCESYNLILHNCEHFSNYVQTGRMHSSQSQLFGAGLAATGLITAGLSEKREARNAGFFIAGLGLLTILLEEL